jgi:hypothetical protein
MRILAGLMLASVLVSTGTECNSAALAPEPDKLQIASWISSAGLHCPTVVSIEKQAEDATGVTNKITCAPTDGKSSWFIRALFNESSGPKFSPWETNPPQWTKCNIQRVSSMSIVPAAGHVAAQFN